MTFILITNLGKSREVFLSTLGKMVGLRALYK